jgi:5'-nucleotidase
VADAGAVRLVITNDDGVDAPGIAALAEAASAFGRVIVVAPLREWSGCGHRVTTHDPLRVEARGADRYAVDGTPGDCVRLALHALAPDADWVLSGINAGGNLGADVVHSGTVAAAREAVLHGRRAIAISHYLRRRMQPDWAAAAARATRVLARLLHEGVPAGRLWNVNLPHLDPGAAEPETVRCETDPSPLPLSFADHQDGWRYSGDYHQRARRPGMDVDVCFGGRIAVSQVGLW